ncbi:MAG TPA: hypothetical protein VHO47_02100 [Candidatus Babeliales bacterium]|nr:hypothetical protein [Candidatus Babeliales bacterium]
MKMRVLNTFLLTIQFNLYAHYHEELRLGLILTSIGVISAKYTVRNAKEWWHQRNNANVLEQEIIKQGGELVNEFIHDYAKTEHLIKLKFPEKCLYKDRIKMQQTWNELCSAKYAQDLSADILMFSIPCGILGVIGCGLLYDSFKKIVLK